MFEKVKIVRNSGLFRGAVGECRGPAETGGVRSWAIGQGS
jgi:hypothetical protein